MVIVVAVVALLSFMGTLVTHHMPMISQSHLPSISDTAWINREYNAIRYKANNLSPKVLKLGLNAYIHARKKGLDNKQILTIVDYSKPSTERRMWVINLKNNQVLYNTWVSHGKNSGTLQANSFSNQPGTLKSSLGLFLTENPYVGGEGYSLRLEGLEKGFNDNAYRRDVVVHGAWYVGGEIATKYGQVGRSWGCLAVNDKIAKPLINTIKENTLIFAYYPDSHWLNHSSYLVT